MRITRHLELLFYKTYADLKAEASQTYLSFLWWIVEPVLYMAVFYIVFGLLFKRGGDGDFIPFLLCGLTVWKWFDSTVRTGANAIRANVGLMRQVYLPKILFPTITILQNTVKFFIVLSFLLIFLQFYGLGIGITYLGLPVLIFVQLLLIAACVYFLAALVPFLPDLAQLIGNGLVMMMFLSGIFFPGSNIPQAYQPYFYLNPMANLVEAYRDILLFSNWPDWSALGWISLVSAFVIWGSWRLLNQCDRIYPKLIS
ncbi:MAG: ABC transporter permease [Pseudomonadota bacterium]